MLEYSVWLIVDTWLSILEEALPRGGWALLDILDWASSGTALLLLMMYVLYLRRIGRAGVSVLYLRRIDHACQVSVLYHACQVSVLYLRRIDHACQEADTSDTHYHIHIQEIHIITDTYKRCSSYVDHACQEAGVCV